MASPLLLAVGVLSSALLPSLAAAAAADAGGTGEKLDKNFRLQSGGVERRLHHKKHRSLIVQPMQADQKLIICNAYASPSPMEIVQVRNKKKLTGDAPLHYKECRDLSIPLEEGDQLDFKAGSLDVGTFFATGLPKFQSSLLLIPHRRSPQAAGASFESHAFSESSTPQIAVIDAYRGQERSNVKIIQNQEPPASADPATKAAGAEAEEDDKVEEDLKYNSVVAVNPGKYAVSLVGLDGHSASQQIALNAAGTSKYVVMRIGTASAADQSETASGNFPQELVVFPGPGESGALPAVRMGIFSVLIMLMQMAW